MKTLFILLFTILQFLSINIKAQAVFPTYSDSAKWSVAEWFWFDISTRNYQFDYDTTFCGHTYSKTSIYSSSPYFYFRSDSLRTFFRFGNKCSSREYLMYDYSLNVGDTVYLTSDLGIFGYADSLMFILNDIDTVNYLGTDRLRFKMHYYFLPLYSGPPRIMYWVKGLGSLTHPFFSIKPLQDGCECHYDLLCYDSLGTQLFFNTQYNTCDTTSLGFEMPKNELSIQIYPNPSSDYFNISIENIQKSSNLELLIYDIKGRKLKHLVLQNSSGNNRVDVKDLASGIYTLHLYSGEKLLAVKQIAVQP